MQVFFLLIHNIKYDFTKQTIKNYNTIMKNCTLLIQASLYTFIFLINISSVQKFKINLIKAELKYIHTYTYIV